MSTRYGTLKQLDELGPNGAALMDYSIFDALRAGANHVVCVVRDEIADAVRAHTLRWLDAGVELSFALQRPEGPDGVGLVGPRQKPWGTGHAVLVAGSQLDEPFAVCNADDFYGRGAFESLAAHLWNREWTPDLPGAVVGYRLMETLSTFGGVSRALCDCGPDGLLTRIIEMRNVARGPGGITGDAGGKDPVTLKGVETVSTNLWGVTPPIVAQLREQFRTFFEQNARDPNTEFLLSTAINQQLAAGASRVRVLPTGSQFLGITFPKDRAGVVETIAELVSSGHYPADLWTESR